MKCEVCWQKMNTKDWYIVSKMKDTAVEYKTWICSEKCLLVGVIHETA